VLILYAADNDLDHGASAEHAEYLFHQFMQRIREPFPALPVAYVSIKPSPSRAWNLGKIRYANTLIQAAAAHYPAVTYLDIFSSMLNSEGGCRPELFTGDGLHMNASGYEIWTRRVRSWLDSIPRNTS
jgi:lysophospholipase L1-like esterase